MLSRNSRAVPSRNSMCMLLLLLIFFVFILSLFSVLEQSHGVRAACGSE